MKKTFERYRPLMARSFALRSFNDNETEINRHFWSFKVISEYSRYIASASKKEDPNTPTASVFKATGPDALRIPASVSKWLDARDELENWLRLSALVSAASYFEMYLGQVVRSALMSDPLRRYGAARIVDGLTLLKAGKEIPYSEDAEQVTNGEWNKRRASFKRLFGSCPISDAQISQLERIRGLRNKFAHGFGRSLDVPSPSMAELGPSERLRHETFLKYLGVISKCAALVDKFLLAEIIGNFELLHFYHFWCLAPKPSREGSYSKNRALQRTFHQQDAFPSVSLEFCTDLISYYDQQ